MAGFQVILADIAAASQKSAEGSDQFAAAVPAALPATRVDSGDGSLDNAVAAVLSGLASMRDRIVDALKETSDKLAQSHDMYQKTDGESARFLYDDMFEQQAVGK